MSITINTDNTIEIDGQQTGLRVTQRRGGTVVYSTSHGGHDYKEHPMPHARYSLAHDAPRPLHATPELAAKFPPSAGRNQFEADVRTLLASADYLWMKMLAAQLAEKLATANYQTAEMAGSGPAERAAFEALANARANLQAAEEAYDAAVRDD